MSVKTLNPVLLVFLFISICQKNHAASFINPKLIHADRKVNETDYSKAAVFVKLSSKEFSLLTGKKLNLFQKLYFKAIRHQLSREVKKNPDLLITRYYDQKKEKFKIDYLWFVVGAIIGPLGILFAFTSKQPKNKKTSAALGCIVFIAWFGFLFFF